MRILLTLCTLLYGGWALQAQTNFYTFTDPHLANQASANLPSLLGDHTKTGEFYPFALYAGFGNNFISAADINQFTSADILGSEQINEYLSKLKASNTIWAGYQLPLFNFYFNIPKKRKPFISFGFGAKNQTDFSLDFNREMLELILRGNKNFAGQTVSLSPSINLLSYNELFLTASAQFQITDWKSKNIIRVKPAIRVRYLNGLAALRMPTNTLEMYTDPEGKYIDFATDMRINMASAVDTPLLNGAFGENLAGSLNGGGQGWGYDLGVGVYLLKNLQIHAALNDLGGINFDRNVINYSKQGELRYDGVNLNELNNGSDSLFQIGKLEEILKLERSFESFRVPLGAKLILNGQYGLKAKKRRRIPYFVHNLSATYVQGMADYLNTTTKPVLHAGYTYSFLNILNIGTGMTLGGLNGFMAGAHLSLKANFFKLGFASNNLLPLISDKAGRGTDIHVFLGFSF
jgi:hypothetical protein